MKFWSTCETTDDVEDLAAMIKPLETHINRYLDNQPLETNISKWVVIYFCVSREFADFFRETIRILRSPERTLETRIEIEHDRFKSANRTQKIEIIVDAVKTALNHASLKKTGISKADFLELGIAIERAGSDFLAQVTEHNSGKDGHTPYDIPN